MRKLYVLAALPAALATCGPRASCAPAPPITCVGPAVTVEWPNLDPGCTPQPAQNLVILYPTVDHFFDYEQVSAVNVEHGCTTTPVIVDGVMTRWSGTHCARLG